VIEERVVDDAKHGRLFVYEADGDADEGEAVHKVRGPIWSVDSVRCGVLNDALSVSAPMGSTQNVGSSVNGSRFPAAYDSSPMLRQPSGVRTLDTRAVIGNSQLVARVRRLELALDELLDPDVVLGDEVNRVLLLVHLVRGRGADRVRACEDDLSGPARERDGEGEDVLEACRRELRRWHGGVLEVVVVEAQGSPRQDGHVRARCRIRYRQHPGSSWAHGIILGDPNIAAKVALRA
jgi:hypothetical protein